MYCCSCKNLDVKNKKKGKVNGNLYFCKKKKSYVSGCTYGCPDFQKASGRKSYQTDEIFKDGKKYSNDTTPVGIYIMLLVVLIILGIIMKVFKI